MKVKYLFFILCINFITCFSQESPKEFEGIITYKTVALSKTEDFSTEKLQKVYGDILTVYYKNGNYKMVYSGNEVKEIYYLKDKNKQYRTLFGSDTMLVSDCSNETRVLVETKITENAEKIMKRNCNLLVNDLGDSKSYYWYNSSVPVNPDHYKKHVFGYVNVYFEKAKSFWLKQKYECDFFDLTHTAIKIKKIKVADSVFTLPNLPEKVFH